MVHLNKLHEKYASKGLVIIGSSSEPESSVQSFVDEHGAKYPIMIEESDTYSELGFGGSIPRAVLIGPAGQVLFKDHPNRLTINQIDNYIESIRLLPEMPKALGAVAKAMDKQQYAKARKAATAALTKEDLREAAQQTLEWIDWFSQLSMEAAKGAAKGGDPYAAYAMYGQVVKAFKGLPVSAEAKAAATALKADKANKDELAAGKKLETLKRKLQKMSSSKAKKAIDAFLKKYADTKAGPRARALLPKDR